MMTDLITVAVVLALSVIAAPWLVLSLQLAAFLLSPPKTRGGERDRPGSDTPDFAVLIPAHNEALVIGDVIRELLKKVPSSTRVLVVADNCEDETANIAKQAGAEVIVRKNTTLIGKSYALEFGLRHLSQAPPEVVVIVDADCTVESEALADLATVSRSLNRPVQSRYLIGSPDSENLSFAVAAFALRVKNWFRPAGMHALGCPCQLTGSGMAFPWHVLGEANVASGSIVEDMALGLELADKGYAPVFLEQAHVHSTFPSMDKAAKSQRTRWEHGHIFAILSLAPRYLGSAVRKGNVLLFAMVIDLIVPPLALLVFMTVGLGAAASLVLALLGSAALLLILAVPIAISAALLMGVWFRCARDILPWTQAWLIPVYVLRKVPIYLSALLRPQRSWVKTNRDKSDP